MEIIVTIPIEQRETGEVTYSKQVRVTISDEELAKLRKAMMGSDAL